MAKRALTTVEIANADAALAIEVAAQRTTQTKRNGHYARVPPREQAGGDIVETLEYGDGASAGILTRSTRRDGFVKTVDVTGLAPWMAHDWTDMSEQGRG